MFYLRFYYSDLETEPYVCHLCNCLIVEGSTVHTIKDMPVHDKCWNDWNQYRDIEQAKEAHEDSH